MRPMRPVILIIAFIILFVSFARVMTPEDTWVCSNGYWAMHGHPSSPQPGAPCLVK
ncbi:MAG: hypothetical protein WCV93_05965 [Candidatus Shapirobacteria bacterium]